MRRRALLAASQTGGGDNAIPNNQIHYTSIDNEIVYPYYKNGFGANIVSNTNENGLGIITFDGDITTFESYVYAEIEDLASITIPNSVTLIEFNAFEWCTQLTSVTIGEGVTEIGAHAFVYCRSLSSVYCKAKTPPSIGNGAFGNNASGRKIYVPMESVDAYRVAKGWIDYTNDIVGYNF